jgi:hypothetical protein
MKKPQLWIVAAAIVLGLAGCFENQSEEVKGPMSSRTSAMKVSSSDHFQDRLLQIAEEYQSYGTADRKLHVGPYLCRLVKNVDYPLPRFSASGDGETHGMKLYVVYAKQVWKARSPGYVHGSYISFPDKTAPVGQVIVKQSWIPEEVPEGKAAAFPELPVSRGMPSRFVKQDGKRYRATRQAELFVMFKLDPATPGTDNGWVNGNVSADGK